MENKDECEIAAVLAHEVKNPVAVIKSNLDYIRSEIPQNLIKNIEVIDNALTRIDKLIESYRLINEKNVDKELIYVEDMLVDIIEDYNISKPDIDFRFNCNSEVSVYGNYDKLSILFYNIYKNAVEAISDNGIIETLCYESDNNAVIKIRDNGVGIEDIESVGTPYYTTKPNGTGLGIIICKNIVSEHNGSINFENTAVGSQVTIKLPLKI